MNDVRSVRCELAMEEVSLLADLVKEALGKGKDDEALTAILAQLQTAQDHAVDGASMRGPANDNAEYEW